MSEWAFEQRNSEQARKVEASCCNKVRALTRKATSRGSETCTKVTPSYAKPSTTNRKSETKTYERRRNFEAGPEGRFCSEARHHRDQREEQDQRRATRLREMQRDEGTSGAAAGQTRPEEIDTYGDEEQSPRARKPWFSICPKCKGDSANGGLCDVCKRREEGDDEDGDDDDSAPGGGRGRPSGSQRRDGASSSSSEKRKHDTGTGGGRDTEKRSKERSTCNTSSRDDAGTAKKGHSKSRGHTSPSPARSSDSDADSSSTEGSDNSSFALGAQSDNSETNQDIGELARLLTRRSTKYSIETNQSQGSERRGLLWKFVEAAQAGRTSRLESRAVEERTRSEMHPPPKVQGRFQRIPVEEPEMRHGRKPGAE